MCISMLWILNEFRLSHTELPILYYVWPTKVTIYYDSTVRKTCIWRKSLPFHIYEHIHYNKKYCLGLFSPKKCNLGQAVQPNICYKTLKRMLMENQHSFQPTGTGVPRRTSYLVPSAQEMDWSQRQWKGDLTICSPQEDR